METIKIIKKSELKNNGQRKEQDADFTLTGKIRKPDKVPFDKGSDIPELNISVKSARFSLCSGGLLKGDTKEEMITDFIKRVASDKFLYVTKDNKGYLMNKEEFKSFLILFTTLEKESEKNSGLIKVRGKRETKEMLEWLAKS